MLLFSFAGECSCWVGSVANVTKESRERYIVVRWHQFMALWPFAPHHVLNDFFFVFRWQKIQRQFIRAEEEVSKLQEFRGLDEFAVMYQPWPTKVTVIILAMCFCLKCNKLHHFYGHLM